MSKSDSTYQNTKVQIPQGADRISIDSDGMFDFYGSTVNGEDARHQLYVKTQVTTIINSAGVLSTVNLPNDAGIIILSVADAASNASAWLTSGPIAGQEKVLIGRGAGSAYSILVSTSGITIIGLLSGDVSSIILHGSNASQPMVRMLCTSDGEWSVIDTLGDVTLQASA